MEANSRSVGTEQINLEIGGNRVRVACDQPAGTRKLRTALSEHVHDLESPLGFVLSGPTSRQGFFVVKDRSGYVLGRSTLLEHAVAVLAGHLTAFIPPPHGSIRANLRAILRRDGTVTCFAWPLFFAPPVVERRLHSLGYAVIDRLVVDVDAQSGRLTQQPPPWPSLCHLDQGIAHVQPSAEPLPITSLMWGTVPDPMPTTRAQTVGYLASAFKAAPSPLTLDLCERLASEIAIIQVPLVDRNSAYKALSRR